MSMINEFVEKLREKSVLFSRSDFAVAGIAKDYKEAADIIEELSAKLANANMERSEQYYKGNSEFVEEIKAKINHKKEYHKNFYEKLGHKLNDNDLHKATQLAFDDCMEFINELAEKYKDVPDTNVGKWIPVSEKLPEERDWYLAVFKEPYTGFIGIPYIADYLLGKHTAYTTKEGWIIKDCTDGKDSCEYFKELECVAWQPLPQPYKGE